MIFKYELTGYGWAESSFFLYNNDYHYNVSYIGESIYDLLYGIIEILHINPGEPSRSYSFNWTLNGEGFDVYIKFELTENSNELLLEIIEADNNKENTEKVFSNVINIDIFINDIITSCEEILNTHGIIGTYIYWDYSFPFDYYLILKAYFINNVKFNIDYDNKVGCDNYEKLKYELSFIKEVFFSENINKKVKHICRNDNEFSTNLFNFELTEPGWSKLELSINHSNLKFNIREIGFILMQVIDSINSFHGNDPNEIDYKGKEKKYGWEIDEFNNLINFDFTSTINKNYMNLIITEMKYKKIFEGIIPVQPFVKNIIESCEKILFTYGLIGFYKHINMGMKHFPLTQYLLLKFYIEKKKKFSKKKPVSNIEQEIKLLMELFY